MFFNCHIHVFQDIDVPRRFLPFALMRILAKKPVFAFIARLLQRINPFSDQDLFDRYARFLTIGKLGSQKNVFEECKKYYPSATQFFVLTMDMNYMKAGPIPNTYENQLKELGELKINYPQIYPFMCVDPRRDNAFELLKRCRDEWNFSGIKLYPLLGYFPYDEKLYPIYEYCQNNNLQVISHCSPFNPVHYRGSRKEIIKLLGKSKTPIKTDNYTKKELFSFFAHPLNYIQILDDFKNLRMCVSHFGSHTEWTKFLNDPTNPSNWLIVMKDLMKQYKNLYTDISFTLNRREFFPILKFLLSDQEINEQILFGSDFYMVETETDERRFGIELRAYIGEDLFQLIATDNPMKFLGLN